jgi:hypothetical protein
LGKPTKQLDILLIEDNPEDIAHVEHPTSRAPAPISLAAAPMARRRWTTSLVDAMAPEGQAGHSPKMPMALP